MKFLLVVALIAGVRAEADAEADPQFLLAGSPLLYGLGHHAVVHTPVVKTVEVKPAEVTPAVAYTYATGYPYAGYGYPYAGVYGHNLGYGLGVWGHGLPVAGLPVAAPAAAAPAAAAEAPAVEAEARKKREADAEADPQVFIGGSPLVYGFGAHHALVHAPVVKSVEVTPAEVKTAAPVVTYATGYPYAGYPYAGVYGAGVYGHHLGYGYGLYGHGLPVIGAPAVAAPAAEAPAVEAEARKKREADAEADPAVLASYTTVHNPAITYALPYAATHGVYSGYPYAGAYGAGVYGAGVYGAGLGYGGVYGAGLGHHLGYGYGLSGHGLGIPVIGAPAVAAPAAEAPAVEAEARKKREADAEADPAVLASYTTVHNPAVTYALPYAATHGVYSGYPYAGAYGAGVYGAGVYGAGLGYGLYGYGK